MRRWHAYLTYGFLLIAATWAVAHVAFHYRSQALARLALWSTFLAFAFGVWSFLVRANARWKEPRGFDVMGRPFEVLDEVVDPSDDHRLVLRFVEESCPKREKYKAYNFHSLVWLVRSDDAWTERVAITAEAFARNANRRWPIAVHSIDPTDGTAILKVGEEYPPDPSGLCDVRYSWREWELIANRQVRVFRTCVDPFELFISDRRDT